MAHISRDELEEQIKNARSMSTDGKKVVYDLTIGVDFSNPRLLGEVLAEVFFKQDASSWFHQEGKTLKFEPEYRAEILVSDAKNREIVKTVRDFSLDLKNDEIRREFADEIDESATYKAGIGTFMFAGILGTLIIESSMRHGEEDTFVRNLLHEIINNTDINSVS